MSWEYIDSPRTLTGMQLPFSALTVQIGMKWTKPEPVEVALVRLAVSMPDLPSVKWPDVAIPLATRILSQGDGIYPDLTLPVSRTLIDTIESWRQGRSTPIRLDIFGHIHFRSIKYLKLLTTTSGRIDEQPASVEHLAPMALQQIRFQVSTHRDQWLEVLKSLGWNELEIFEVAVRPARRDKRFQRAMELLGAAQTALRQGQWPTVATDARKALEAAAGIVAPDEEDRRARFDALIKEVLTSDHDKAKRDMLSGLMFALKELRDEAAHGGNLNAQVDREDAELAFTVAVSIFRYIGEVLARRER